MEEQLAPPTGGVSIPASPLHNRPFEYQNNECWQYTIRQKNLQGDLQTIGLDAAAVSVLRTKDFVFSFVDKTDPLCREIVKFIERHEWLGKMPSFPTHRFVATYKGQLAGVVVLAMPNAFSKLLGENTRKIERLIARGACVSWSPKNLASSLVSFACRWMVSNTNYRLFTAYSDPEARELGTIYQACNFIYLGQQSGTQKMFFDLQHPERGWFSDRTFRSRSSYVRYAKELGFDLKNDGENMNWSALPEGAEAAIKQRARDHQKKCQSRVMPPKHKYCLILGKTKKETEQLVSSFRELNPQLVDRPYPKERGK